MRDYTEYLNLTETDEAAPETDEAAPETDEAAPECDCVFADGCEGDPFDTETEPKAAEVSTRATNKSHLTSSVPRAARVPGSAMTKGQMAEIRAIFGDIDDAEIQRLYKRVTK